MNNSMNHERYIKIKGAKVMDQFPGNRLIGAVVLDMGLSPSDALVLSYGTEAALKEAKGDVRGYSFGDEESEGAFSSMVQTPEEVSFKDISGDRTATTIEHYREMLAEWADKVHEAGYDFSSTQEALEVNADLLAKGHQALSQASTDQ